MAPWKHRVANVDYLSLSWVCVGEISLRSQRKDHIGAAKVAYCVEGTQETATLPEAEVRNHRTKSWSERLGSWSSSDPIITNAAYA